MTSREKPEANSAAEEPEPISIGTPVDVRSVTLSIIAVLAAILMLQYARAVLIPVVIAVLISYVVEPPVTSLQNRGIPRVLGSFLAISVLCAALGFGFSTLTDEAMAIVESIPTAARRLADRFETRRGEPEGTLEKMQTAAKEIEQAAEQASEPSTAPRGVQRVQIVQPAFAARDYLWEGWRRFFTGLSQFAVVLFLVFFLLVTGDLFKRKLVKIAGPTLTKKKISVQIMDEINRQISGFLRVQVITSAIVGVATGAVLWWFEVEHFVIWGLLAGVFNSIPYLGPLMVTAGLALVTFMQFDDLWRTTYVAGATLVITSLEGWLLTPALMSRASRMNPVAIFIGLLFWSWIWGVWGTILA
ncbi:MAG: AI-2E family transporter, partial [Vicinamibacterales bacterium]